MDPFAAGPLLNVVQAAAVLNIPEQTLRKLVTARKVPHTRIGKHVRFGAHHLAAIVAAGEQEVAAPQRRQAEMGADGPIRTPPQTGPLRRGGRRRSTL